MNDGLTHVIELTPPGRAAVAVVLVAGPKAFDVVRECATFRALRSPQRLSLQQIALAHWGSPSGEEVVLCRRADDHVEIHCHGGAAAVREVIDRLIELGCPELTWSDWLRATEVEPLRAAARIALAAAPTERTATILLEQYHGALAAAIRNVLQGVQSGDHTAATKQIDELVARGQLGVHLTTPWQVVIAGPPNVGKSSLLNALAGFQRAIVSPLAGTTRDVVTLSTAIDGWPVTLADTAGLRMPGDEIEAAGVELARAAIDQADLVLDVAVAAHAEDASHEVPQYAWQIKPACPSIRVWNKTDLLPPHHFESLQLAAQQTTRPSLLISAATSAGIPALVAAIGQALVPAAPQPDDAVPFTIEQVDLLSAVRTELIRGDIEAVVARLQSLLAHSASDA